MGFIRRSSIYLMSVALIPVFFLAVAMIHSSMTKEFHQERRNTSAGLVKQLGLTDLCLFTEASYTRHPSQADVHSAFKDHPASLDHFPSGSFFAPPRGLWR